MSRVFFILTAMLVMIAGAWAQDITSLKRAAAGLSSPPKAEEISALGNSNPNAYVYFMQGFLKDTGGYGGAVNGQLTTTTIRAMVAYCRAAGFAETCIRGPLLPESIAAMSRAVAAAMVPAEVAAEPEPPLETVAVEVDPATQPSIDQVAENPPVLPEGWRVNDNGSRGSLGLVVALISAGSAEAVFHVTGTAAQRGYINIELSPSQPASPGTWTTSLEGSSVRSADTGGVVWLRTAKLSDDAYLGELFEGVPLGDGGGRSTASGVADAEVKRLLPLVQVWVEAGEVIDTTVTLRNPTCGKQ